MTNESSKISERDRLSEEIAKIRMHVHTHDLVFPILQQIREKQEASGAVDSDLEFTMEISSFIHEQDKAKLEKLIELRDKYFIL